MKAITIHQPWATLIALGEKRFETRSWPTKYRGPLAIHAGKQVDKEICQQEPFRSVLTKYGYTADNLPTGAVVAVVELKECFKIRRDLLGGVVALESDARKTHFNTSDKEHAFGWYDSGRFAWELRDVQRLMAPIPAKGQQRIWNWEGDKEI